EAGLDEERAVPRGRDGPGRGGVERVARAPADRAPRGVVGLPHDPRRRRADVLQERGDDELGGGGGGGEEQDRHGAAYRTRTPAWAGRSRRRRGRAAPRPSARS